VAQVAGNKSRLCWIELLRLSQGRMQRQQPFPGLGIAGLDGQVKEVGSGAPLPGNTLHIRGGIAQQKCAALAYQRGAHRLGKRWALQHILGNAEMEEGGGHTKIIPRRRQKKQNGDEAESSVSSPFRHG
jgi:hypothetical protein